MRGIRRLVLPIVLSSFVQQNLSDMVSKMMSMDEYHIGSEGKDKLLLGGVMLLRFCA
jgi:hypothetical protein